MSFDRPFVLESSTGAALSVRHLRPMAPPRGVVLILHGLAEHAGRYARTAAELVAQGFAVYAHDHRGHGSTTAFDAPLRRFAARNGVDKVLHDVGAVRDRAASDWPGLPMIVFGHSMGGLIALCFAARFGDGLSGLAAWNADAVPGVQTRVGKLALRLEKALKGSDVASRLFARATFAAWAETVRPRHTRADWLSHDPDEVDAYLRDPLCGWTPTISMAEDIVAMVDIGGDPAALRALSPALPLHLLGGGEDPATRNGAAVSALAGRARTAGLLDVTCTIVPGARHETLNETDPFRGPAMRSLCDWLDRIAPPAAAFGGSLPQREV